MKKYSLLRQGFTLIELLVVVAIIGILMAAGTVAFTSAQRSSRDARRKSDVRSISTAFEQYYLSNGTYNGSAAVLDSPSYFSSSQRPRDPRSGLDYPIEFDAGVDAVTFCVCATLETPASGNASAGPQAGGTCAFATGATAGYFCLSSSQ